MRSALYPSALRILYVDSLFYRLYSNHIQHTCCRNPEPYIKTGKRHSVHSHRVIVILWARVKLKHLDKNGKILVRKESTQLVGETHLDLFPALLIDKATAYAGVGISILNIGFYVIDWSAVDKVGTCNNKGKHIAIILHSKQSHR